MHTVSTGETPSVPCASFTCVNYFQVRHFSCFMAEIFPIDLRLLILGF